MHYFKEFTRIRQGCYIILSISLFVINIFMIILNGSLNALPGKIDIFYNLSLTNLCNFKDKKSDEIDLANISGLAAKLTVLIDGDLFDDAIATQKKKFP